jgi:DNA-binding IclR family transcriptional regulator
MAAATGRGEDAAGGLLVLGKITSILDAFTLARPVLTPAELRAATGLPASTLQRLVANLVQQGFLDRAEDERPGGVRIGVRMAYWAAPTARGLDLLDVAAPVLRGLRDATGETACLFRVEGLHRVCVALAETRHALRRVMRVGMVLPLHAGSAGRVLLAHDDALLRRVLDEDLPSLTDVTITGRDELVAAVRRAREDGVAVTTGERDSGASGLSAPVVDAAGEVVAALTLSGPTLRMTPGWCAAHVDAVVGAAEQVTRMLGGRPPR